MRFFLLIGSLLGIAEVLAGSYPAGCPARSSPPRAGASPAQQYRLCCGLRATVQGHAVVITNAKGAVVARNNQLIRLAADARDCPLDGFQGIVSKGEYFTIEQQNCGGWLFSNEYLTFRYVPGTGQILLHKFGLSFTDRREPDKLLPDKVFTTKQFGQRSFGQVTLAELERLDR